MFVHAGTFLSSAVESIRSSKKAQVHLVEVHRYVRRRVTCGCRCMVLHTQVQQYQYFVDICISTPLVQLYLVCLSASQECNCTSQLQLYHHHRCRGASKISRVIDWIRITEKNNRSGCKKKIRLRTDPDPQHCKTWDDYNSTLISTGTQHSIVKLSTILDNQVVVFNDLTCSYVSALSHRLSSVTTSLLTSSMNSSRNCTFIQFLIYHTEIKCLTDVFSTLAMVVKYN